MSSDQLLESGGLSDSLSYSGPAKAVLSLNSSPSQLCSCVGDCSCNPGTVGTPLVPRRARPGYGSCSPENSREQSLRCHCHVVEAPKKVDKTARNKLLIACAIALVFTIGEAAGRTHSSLTHS